MRKISTYTILCLGTAIVHIRSANGHLSSSQSTDTDGLAPETEPYRLAPLAVKNDENNDPLVPEIPNAKSHYNNDPFYLDDFEPRDIIVPAPDFSAIDEFDLASKARFKRAEPTVDRAGGPHPPPAAVLATTDVSKEMAISEVGILVDATKADLIPKICDSREFKPTLENYWISRTDDFLRDYSRDNQGFSNYQRDGLLKSLAKKYLGDDTYLDCSFHGGIFSTKKCNIACSDVLKHVNDVALGRKVYFSLAAAVGFSQVMGVMHDSFSEVPERLASMVGLMPEIEHALAELTALDVISSEAQLFSEALRHAVVAAAPWHSVEKVFEKADADLAQVRNDYGSALQVYEMIEGGSDPHRLDKLFNKNYEPSISDLDLPRSDAADHVLEASSASTEAWHGKSVQRAKQALLDSVAFIKTIGTGELGRARESGYSVLEDLFNHIRDVTGSDMDASTAEVPRQVAARSKAAIVEAVEKILRGGSVGSDGSTNLSKLLSYGNFLPLGNKQNLSKFKSANPVEKLTKNIFMRLFDLSFDRNKIYVSCTKDAQRRSNPRKDEPGPKSSCKRDNSGPQNLKACVGDYTCYMYRWSERKFDYLSHSKEPKGMAKWGDPPFNISAEDIITSSVLSQLQGLKPGKSADSLSDILEATADGISSLDNPQHPGVFHLPICFSRQNWNTQVTGWGTLCDTDPHCPAKNFPCTCGAWGQETDFVWREMGVGQDEKRKNYAQHLCPRQISRKVDDPLERYMAYCALDIRRNSPTTRVNGLVKFAGKDKYCAIFQSIIALKGYESIEDIDPEVKFAFTCKIKKGGKGCSMYNKMFEGLWKGAFDAGYLTSASEPKELYSDE